MRTRQPGVDVTVPITPMLDMSFQLLAFFILTFRLVAPEGQLAAAMPAAGPANANADLPGEDVEKDHYTITVFAAGGQIGSMNLTGPTTSRSDIRTLRELREAVESLPKPAGGGADGVTFAIEASDDLRYSQLVAVIDLCNRAGYMSVSLAAIQPGRAT